MPYVTDTDVLDALECDLPDEAVLLSPRRKTSSERTADGLAREQLEHFGIDPASAYGRTLFDLARKLYGVQTDVSRLWTVTMETIQHLDKTDRIAYFNAKKFLSFQVAKILDTLQNPFRKSYQTLMTTDETRTVKGPYPVFDNVTALFSANPVIVRTATYIYACTEWIDDAFQGKEQLHEIYSRLLNPTSISLANHIVDLEAGPYAGEYLAWNFNSGMAAIDCLLSHLLDRGDIVVASRNVYGGTHQLLHDYYASDRKYGIHLEWFDGYTGSDFSEFLSTVMGQYTSEIEEGRRVFVYIESPCNPHGYVLDVPGICEIAHAAGATAIHDATIATPFLTKPLQRENPDERPDYVIHSYTKDLTGNGNATAGVVIGRNERMFIPKGETVSGVSWEDTLFWGVYYVKGAFLDADKAFEVISGMKTLEMRLLRKCANTAVLARFLASNEQITVSCNVLESNPNYATRSNVLRYGLAAPLFTVDFERSGLSIEAFTRFFDSLAPAFNHQVSLGQSNTTILCPALTSHSELDRESLEEADIRQTTIRISVGDENPKELAGHFVSAARMFIDPEIAGFTRKFMSDGDLDALFLQTNRTTYDAYWASGPKAAAFLTES